jgi:protein TonB
MTDDEIPFVPEAGEDAAEATKAPSVEPAPNVVARIWPFFAFAGIVAATLLAVFLLLHPRAGGAAAEAASGAPAYVTLDGTALRRAPAADGESVATLAAGARVTLFAGRGPWIEAETESGERGFLPSDSVERRSDREARQRREKMLLGFAPVYGVVGEAADVALAPYPLAARGGRLAKGTVIAIHSVDHSYFAFRDKTWGVAFVNSAAVDLIPPDPREPAISPEKVRPLKNLTIIDLEEEPPPEEEVAGEAAEAAGDGEDAPAVPAPPPAAPAEPATPGLVEGPVVLKRVEPVYPDLARRAGIDGTVELEVSIDAAGKVTNVEVVRGLPLGLSQAAADAVHQWTYKPARTAAGPVATRKSVRIRFVLKPE